MSYVELLEQKATERRENESYKILFADDAPEHPDYNPKSRRNALDGLLEFIEGDIEQLEDYAKSESPEKQQVAREYDGLLAKLREYAELIRKDRFDADCDYHADESYWDSLDD